MIEAYTARFVQLRCTQCGSEPRHVVAAIEHLVSEHGVDQATAERQCWDAAEVEMDRETRRVLGEAGGDV